MGAYITIVNDTNDEWYCKVSHDKRPIEVASWIFAVGGLIHAIYGVIISLGLLSAAMLGFGTTGFVVNVLTYDNLRPLHGVIKHGTVVESKNPGLKMTESITEALKDRMKQQNFIKLSPNDNHRFYSADLVMWRQGICLKLEPRDTTNVILHRLIARPLEAGSKAGSTREYYIDSWLKTEGALIQIPIKGIKGSNDLNNSTGVPPPVSS